MTSTLWRISSLYSTRSRSFLFSILELYTLTIQYVKQYEPLKIIEKTLTLEEQLLRIDQRHPVKLLDTTGRDLDRERFDDRK